MSGTDTLTPPAQHTPKPLATGGTDRRSTTQLIRRLTRRDLRRSRGRSWLIVSFFAAPLAFMVFVLWTSSIDASGNRDSDMGQATAVLVPFADTQPRAPAKAATDPAGALLISTSSVNATVGGVPVPLTAVVLDQSDSRLAGLIEPVAGTNPGTDQVTLTRSIANRLHLGVGSKLAINGRDYHVKAIVRATESLDGVLVPAGHPLAADAAPAKVLLFGTPLSPEKLKQLGAEGWDYRPATSDSAGAQGTTAVVALALSLLFAVASGSLASVAFAVGARQQRRTLAVIASVGGTRDTLQRLVLTTAWRLGLIGTLIGMALGMALVYAVYLEAEASSTKPKQPFVFPWLLLAIPAVTSLVAALVAGWLPARWVTKQEALQAIRSSEAPASRARFPRVGVALALAGLALAAVPLVTGVRKNTTGDGFLNPSMVIFPAAGATVLLFVATVVSAGWLLQQLGRLKWRGLAVRLAFRDAVRHRGRATSALVATLAISMLAGVVLTITASLSATLVRDYQPTYPPGRASLYVFDQGDASATKDAEAAIVATLGTPLATWRSSTYGEGGVRVAQREGSESEPPRVTVGDAAAVEFWTGQPITPAVADALARGVTIVFDARLLTDGKVTVDVVSEAGESRQVSTPGLHVAGVVGSGVPALMPAATATKLGLPAPAPGPVFFDFGRTLTSEDNESVRTNLGPIGFQSDWTVEAGSPNNLDYTDAFGVSFSLILLAVAVIVSLLTLVDARANYATLAQIGAARITLRRIAATQAWVTSATGAVLGLVAGWLPTWLVIISSRDLMVAVLPWQWALVMVLGVPLVGGLVSALVVRPPRAAATRVQ